MLVNVLGNEPWSYDPSMRPVFEEVADGFYYLRAEMVGVPKVGFCDPADAMKIGPPLKTRLVPCKIPRTNTSLRWLEAWE